MADFLASVSNGGATAAMQVYSQLKVLESMLLLDLERFDMLLVWFGQDLTNAPHRVRDPALPANKKGMSWMRKHLAPLTLP